VCRACPNICSLPVSLRSAGGLIAIAVAGCRVEQSNSMSYRRSSLPKHFPYLISGIFNVASNMAVSITPPPRSYTRIISNVLNDIGSDMKTLVQIPKNTFTITSLDVMSYRWSSLPKRFPYFISGLSCASCSDVLLNWKQLNSELQNAVVAPLFTLTFTQGRV